MAQQHSTPINVDNVIWTPSTYYPLCPASSQKFLGMWNKRFTIKNREIWHIVKNLKISRNRPEDHLNVEISRDFKAAAIICSSTERGEGVMMIKHGENRNLIMNEIKMLRVEEVTGGKGGLMY